MYNHQSCYKQQYYAYKLRQSHMKMPTITKLALMIKITFKPSSQFSTEQHISQFGLGVSLETAVAAFLPV